MYKRLAFAVATLPMFPMHMHLRYASVVGECAQHLCGLIELVHQQQIPFDGGLRWKQVCSILCRLAHNAPNAGMLWCHALTTLACCSRHTYMHLGTAAERFKFQAPARSASQHLSSYNLCYSICVSYIYIFLRIADCFDV